MGSESDREFFEDGKTDSSGDSDIQSADDEDALAKMYGPESKYMKQKEAERKKKQAKIDKKNKRRTLGEESIAFGFGKPVLERKKDANSNFKVPTWDDLDKGEANTSLSFGFGLVDTDVYLAKEDPKDVVKTINETKNATDVSFSKSSQPEFLAKREDYWATKRERRSREKAFKRKERDKIIMKQQRARIKQRQQDLIEATKKLKRMKRATDEWIQNQLETQAAIVENRQRRDVLFEVTSFQSINRHPAFVGYRKQKKKYDVNVSSPIFWGYNVQKIEVEPVTKVSVVNKDNRVDVEKMHPGSIPAAIDYYDEDYQLDTGITPPPQTIVGTHASSSLFAVGGSNSPSRGRGSRRSRKKRKKRKTGAQMLAEYEKKQREKEAKQLAKQKEIEENKEREIRENYEDLEKNHKHIAFYGMFRTFAIERSRCNTHVECPAFFGYIRDQRDEGESEEEEDVYEEFDIKQLEPFGSRCLICKARPGVRGFAGCPACFDLNEKMPHTYPKREDDDVYEPVYVRPQGIVSLEDMKQNVDQDKEQG